MGKGVLLMRIKEVGETSVNFGSYSNNHKQILVEEVAWWLGWHKSFEASRISVYVFFFIKLTYFFLCQEFITLVQHSKELFSFTKGLLIYNIWRGVQFLKELPIEAVQFFRVALLFIFC